MADGDTNIKVVVRCRPLNTRGISVVWFEPPPPSHTFSIELARGAKNLIRMHANQTFLDPPDHASQQDSKRATERKTMSFSFDKSYWSAGPRDDPLYCSQQTLYDDLGKELLDHGFAGFNACILACQSLASIITQLTLTSPPQMVKQVRAHHKNPKNLISIVHARFWQVI